MIILLHRIAAYSRMEDNDIAELRMLPTGETSWTAVESPICSREDDGLRESSFGEECGDEIRHSDDSIAIALVSRYVLSGIIGDGNAGFYPFVWQSGNTLVRGQLYGGGYGPSTSNLLWEFVCGLQI